MARTPSPVTAESAGRAGSEPLRRGPHGRLSGTAGTGMLSPRATGVQASAPPRLGQPLGRPCFRLPSELERQRTAGAQENWRGALQSRPLCNNDRDNARFQACGGSSPSPLCAFVKISEYCHSFCLLSSQRPMHLERVGADMPVSGSRGFLRG